jgi:hypothetical protein
MPHKYLKMCFAAIQCSCFKWFHLKLAHHVHNMNQMFTLPGINHATKNKEAGTGSMPQSEISSRVFSSKKHIFSKTPGEFYQSKEDLMNRYVVKGSMANSEIRDLLLKVEKISQHKYSLFSVRDVERKRFNIAIEDDDKVSEIKMHYENIGAPDKVKFHSNVSDMLYSDYLSLSLKVSRLTTYELKLDGQLK